MVAIDHYEWVLDVQIDTISHIDSKAVSQIAFVGTILVAVVAGVGLLIRMGPRATGIAYGTPVVALLAFVIAVSSLLLSIGYSVITVTVGWFAYGLRPAIGEVLVDGRLERAEYTELLLRGYTDAITANEHVIERAGERFRKANSAMLTGLIALIAASVLYLFGSDRPIEFVAVLAGSVLVWVSNEYVLSGTFPVHGERGVTDESPQGTTIETDSPADVIDP